MRTTALRLAALVLGAIAPAGTGVAGDPPASGLATVIDVRVVDVDVVATDASGERVRGLRKDDFTLFVDGRPVPIEYFAEVIGGTVAPEDHLQPATAPTAAARAWLVFVDNALAIAKFRDRALQDIENNLDRLGPGDLLAVAAFDGDRVQTICDWTADRNAQHRALAAARESKTLGLLRLAQSRQSAGYGEAQLRMTQEALPAVMSPLGAPPPPPAGQEDPMGDGPPAGTATPPVAAQLRRTDAALAVALRALATPTGRRVVVLLSGDWALGTIEGTLPRALTAASRHNYSIYPVDTSARTPEALLQADRWAEITGGRAIAVGKGSSFQKVTAESSVYYSLGFTPLAGDRDGIHQIHVETARPGVTLRSRTEYAEVSGRTDAKLSVEQFLLLGAPPEDRRLEVEMAAIERAAHGRWDAHVQVRVPVDLLSWNRSTGGSWAVAYLSAAVEDSTGDRVIADGFRGRMVVEPGKERDGFATIRLRLLLRRADQRLLFAAAGTAHGPYVWGQIELDRRAVDGRVSAARGVPVH